MSDVTPDTSEDAAGGDDAGFSPVVAAIFDSLLDAIHDGRMPPGERINDGQLAGAFHVSRTPVREALQRLRDLGLVEAVPGRFTRVAVVSPLQTAHAMIVWTALYRVLVEEVIAEAPATTHEAMARDHAAFLESLPGRDFLRSASANFLFFGHLMTLSRNPILLQGISRVVHLIRLGSLHLPKTIDVAALADAQARLLDAVSKHDLESARQAIAKIRNIDIPLE